MYISEKLRTENIAEYLLYMWQVEDMIRAAGHNSDRLYNTLIRESGRSKDDCLKWKQWYDDLIEMMYAEGKASQGHLQINENVLILIEDLHLRLLKSDKQSEYRELFYKALPFILEFRDRSNEGEKNEEIRDCFNMLYGVWMLKLQGKPISEPTAQAVQAVSAFTGKLAFFYKEEMAGRLDLD